jgi:demethylmenaquinone methyltransferase/2-methoxy-6-polyprenyl-1,4-benzoquinol methylase
MSDSEAPPGSPGSAELLDEQLRYYRARAGEYDDWWFRRGRYDRGSAFNAAFLADAASVEDALCRYLDATRPANALELACGTGLFTRHLAPRVGRLTAIDASPEVLALNCARMKGAPIDYVLADLFDWQPRERYDLVFMSFWLSHVPEARLERFWHMVADALADGGSAYVIDSAHEPTSTARDHPLPSRDAGVVRRRLDDGRAFQVVKVFWEPDTLAARLGPLGWQCALARTPLYFIHGRIRREQAG